MHSSWMIVSDNIFQTRERRDRVSRQFTGHHRRFDASDVESATSPIAGDRQVVVSIIQRRYSVTGSSRQRQYIALRRIDVRDPVLSIEQRLIGLRRRRGILLMRIHQQLPSEVPLTADSLGPKLADVGVEEPNRVRSYVRATRRSITIAAIAFFRGGFG